MRLHFVERNEAERDCHGSVTRSARISEPTTTPGNAAEKLPGRIPDPPHKHL